jgi:hypothetical protein
VPNDPDMKRLSARAWLDYCRRNRIRVELNDKGWIEVDESVSPDVYALAMDWLALVDGAEAAVIRELNTEPAHTSVDPKRRPELDAFIHKWLAAGRHLDPNRITGKFCDAARDHCRGWEDKKNGVWAPRFSNRTIKRYVKDFPPPKVDKLDK